MAISLGELASRFECDLVGDPDLTVDNVASLDAADSRSLSFLANPAYRQRLAATKAAAVILRAEFAGDAPTACLISQNPYASYAQMAAVIYPPPSFEPGIHPAAQVADSASIATTAYVAANVFIGNNAVVGEFTYVGPGCVVGDDCSIGDHGRLIANVTLVRQVEIGSRCILHPGAVIGSDGFGNAMTPEGWIKVPQVGGVKIGNDVEIGANSAIDCGAIGDTVIEDGVRIDNLVMIAHNVRIGAHTAIAGQCGFAGSTVIGKRCMFAGHSGAVGHLTVCDDVVVSAQGMLTKNITEPGVYASSFAAEPVRDWNRRVARVRRLDKLIERVSRLEKGKS
jgi:UDP-3-O-[3-hydroxymyristoyl] glucosamine N-acyltransferase